ncbi:MAG TPA: DUF222 domain-containing protein [Acidimicrobiales bacterium]|nr:DUF222 domain-containing protein [Acidimicrobiales bacterium]
MFEELTTPTLRSELCSQAAHVSAGECRLVLLVGEFDRRGTWAAEGCRSCAHWLNWRVGTSLGAAREQVRVGRALGALPRLRAAFARGELSYSKVRAITRVANPALEESLVALARDATASQLEQIVREYRRADPDEARLAEGRREGRYVRSYTDEEGMVVIRARLCPEDGAVVLAAIEAAKAALAEAADVSAETPKPVSDVFTETPSYLEAEADDPWRGTVLRAELTFEESLQGLETKAADALVALCTSVLGRGLGEEMEDPHISVLVHVDEQVLDDASAPGCAHIEGVGAIGAHAARRLACEGAVSRLVFAVDGAVEAQGTSRTVPWAMRRALLARDRGCRWPGCTTRRFLHAHHVVFWSRGGPTALSNLVALCGAHHRLVHEGGWNLRLERSGALQVRSPAGVELPAVPACRAAGDGLVEAHSKRGLHIGPDTLAYGGERFDLGLTIDALLCVAGKIDC